MRRLMSVGVFFFGFFLGMKIAWPSLCLDVSVDEVQMEKINVAW